MRIPFQRPPYDGGAEGSDRRMGGGIRAWLRDPSNSGVFPAWRSTSHFRPSRKKNAFPPTAENFPGRKSGNRALNVFRGMAQTDVSRMLTMGPSHYKPEPPSRPGLDYERGPWPVPKFEQPDSGPENGAQGSDSGDAAASILEVPTLAGGSRRVQNRFRGQNRSRKSETSSESEP